MIFFGPLVESLIRALSKTPKQKFDLFQALNDKMEQERQLEPFGLADWQKSNAALEALRQPHVITPDEFRSVILPALRHIRSLPDDAESERVASQLFALSGDDWRAASRAKDALMERCDAHALEPFIRGVCGAYDVLRRAQREQCQWVRPLWDVRHCPVCRASASPEKDLGASIKEALERSFAAVQPAHPDSLSAAQLLGQFEAGRYELPHEVFDEDDELARLCPGPMLASLRPPT